MENQFLSKLIKNAPHLKWFPFPFIQPVKASLSLTPLPPQHCCLIPPSSLYPSFALLLSPDGNYLHKSGFALWFAPSHKWRLSLFNRGGFASHVKAYNVAGPCFLHTTVTDLSLSGRGRDAAAAAAAAGRGAVPRLRLTGPEEASALDQASDSFTWLRGEQEVVKKSPLVKGLRIRRVCPDRMLLCTASHREDG